MTNYKFKKRIALLVTSAIAASSILSSTVHAETLPGSYSSVEKGYISEVKNQGKWGLCWAFASSAASEASIAKEHGKDIDLSENLIAYVTNFPTTYGYVGNDKIVNSFSSKTDYLNESNNPTVVASLMMNWIGPFVEDEDYPYSSNSIPSLASKSFTESEWNKLIASSPAKLTDFYKVSVNESEYINKVKQLVTTYGAATMTYYDQEEAGSGEGHLKCVNGEYYYFCPYSSYNINHTVTVVGYDDSIPASNFANNGYQPSGNGGWLIKNSWDTSFGNDGYMWLSYYDSTIDEIVAFDFAMEGDKDYYDNLYSYDGGMPYQTLTGGSSTIYSANIFTANNDEIIKGAAFFTEDKDINNTYYEVSLYLNPDADNPTSGTKATTATISPDYMGYHSVEFPVDTEVQAGDTFAVVVKAVSNFNQALAYFENKTVIINGNTSVDLVANENESFVSANGVTWTNAPPHLNSKGNAMIKAYTVANDGTTRITDSMVSDVSDVTYNGKEQKPVITVKNGTTTLTQGTDYTVSYANNKNAGTATVTINGIGNYKGTVTKTFTINKASLSDCIVNLDKSEFTYTGSAITPDISVYLNEAIVLAKGTDYTVTYKNNVYASTADDCACITITGKGNYKDSTTIHFTIKALDPCGDDNHEFSTFLEKTEPTCSADGSATAYCDKCGALYTYTLPADPTLHTYTSTVVDPTTESEGYTLHECTFCGYSYKSDYTDKIVKLSPIEGFCLGGRADTALRLNWNKSSDADGYIIEAYLNNEWKEICVADDNGITTCRVEQLTANTSYQFRMKSYADYDGKTIYSDYTDIITAKTNPSAVSGFKLGGRASNALRLNWTKNGTADGYIIEQYKSGKWVRVAKITSNATTTYKVTGLKAGTAYKFRMRAYKMDGSNALYSTYTSTLSARTSPSNVTGFKLGGRAANALRLNWTKNTSADGYIVEQYKSGKWVRIAKIASNATTTYKISGLKASTQYKFRVRAYKMSGKTALYSGYTSTLSAYTTPSKVANLKITGKATTALRLGWSKNTSADGYIIEMYKDGKWVRAAKIASNATVTFRKSGLKKGTTYKFRVRTYNMVGKTVLYGNYVNVSGTTNK